MITRALKLAPASTLAPLHYSLLLWAVIFGLAFFGDMPGPRILIGSGIIVLAGLFISIARRWSTRCRPKTRRRASTSTTVADHLIF